jgi:ADP-dependent NAD(P)H-hydrate dehydratase / NAD(P)H-hydrate epimerase
MVYNVPSDEPNEDSGAMKLVTTTQMRELEAAAVQAGATWPGLMEQAGWGVAQEAVRLLRAPHGRGVLALVGPGNNGGDALVAARHLHDAGARVALYFWRRADSPDDANRRRCRERDIAEHEASDDPGQADLRHLLESSDLVLDGLLGMGVSRLVEGQLAEIVATVNNISRRPPTTAPQSSAVVLSIDMPTGIHSDSGSRRPSFYRLICPPASTRTAAR